VPRVQGSPYDVFPWAKSDTFPAGERATRHFQLGPDPKRVGTSERILHGSLRVGFTGEPQAPENFTAWVIPPDNGSMIGPLDLPFEMTVGFPVRVEVRADVAPAAAREVLATLSYPAVKLRWAATRREIAPEGPANAVIPQWVHSISICKIDATLTLFDAVGNVVCALVGPVWDVPRPRLAVLMSTVDPGGTAVLFSYEA
jgi:hypothetical protein